VRHGDPETRFSHVFLGIEVLQKNIYILYYGSREMQKERRKKIK
jgi:hypothetical protein